MAHRGLVGVYLLISLMLIYSCREGGSENAYDDTKAYAGDWPLHALDGQESRCSPLTQIHQGNLDSLGLLWSYDLGMKRGVEASPIVSEGVMYFTGPWSVVFAVDVRTGKEIWKHDPKVPGGFGEKGCCDVVNRGVAMSEGKVFFGTFDGRLIALDAKSGQVIWEIPTTDTSKPYTITGAPRVIGNKVIIGNGGAELGVRGYFSAYDVKDGTMLWRFYTVPGDPAQPFENDAMKMAASTWTGTWWEYGGGGTVWDAMAYDAKLNLLYVGTGNGSPWDRNKRSPEGGDNLFLSSILAINPDSGKLVWHYQTTPGDSWDFTATQHIVLADITINNKPRKVLMQAPKNGFFYVLDRTDGQLISAEKFTYVNWADSIDLASGRPVEAPLARYGSANIDVAPNYNGAHNWQPMAYSQSLGLVFIPARETFSNYGPDLSWQYNKTGFGTGVGWNLAIGSDPGLPTIADSSATNVGKLIAWDPVTQKERWHIVQDQIWNGGLLATASNLLFQGTADGYIKAYNAADGTEIWKAYLGTGILAPPTTYEVDGKQYLTVITGWGGGYGMKNKHTPTVETGRVFTFALGGQEALPEVREETERSLARVSWELLDYEIGLGETLFNKFCGVCHITGKGTGGIAPNLSYSPHIGSPSFDMILLQGGLENRGMPSFQSRLSEEDTHAIQTYIMKTARDLRVKK